MESEQNSFNFIDDISKCVFINEEVWILIMISQKLVNEVLLTRTQH